MTTIKLLYYICNLFTYSNIPSTSIYLFLPNNDKQATAQKVNLLSISPHWSPMKLPWSVCNPFTYFTTPSTSISSRQSNITAIWKFKKRRPWSLSILFYFNEIVVAKGDFLSYGTTNYFKVIKRPIVLSDRD